MILHSVNIFAFVSKLLKMAATVMAFEFGTIHHNCILQENSEACLSSSTCWTDSTTS